MCANKYIYFIILLIFSALTVNSQTPEDINIIENLEKRIDSTNNTIEKIELNIQIAQIYLDYNADKTLEYLDKVDKLTKKTTPQSQLAAKIFATYGNAFYKKGDRSKALKYFEKQLSELEKTQANTDSVTFNIAVLAYEEAKYDKAEEYYIKLLNKAKQYNNKNLISRLYQTLYKVNLADKDYKDAVDYLNLYLQIVDENFFNATQKISILNDEVTVNKIKLKNTTNELIHTQKVLIITDSNLHTVTIEKNQLEIDTLLKAHQIDSLEIVKINKERELERQEAENKLQAQELASRKKFITLLSSIIIFIAIGGFFIFILYRRIKKQNKLLSKQKLEIQIQSNQIKDKNIQITESIFYASRIQNSILPPKERIFKELPETFIFFRPRDIVSGDFYWFSKIDDTIIISVIDCTGHGVPGAFISMIGNTLLNKIVNEERNIVTSAILESLHEQMMMALQQNNTEDETEDGMDMVICAIEKENNKLYFSGAKNSLLLMHNDEFSSVKGDYFSIGEKPLRPGMKTKFKNHQIDFDISTYIFLMTDGIIDQFGKDEYSTDYEKFNYDRLKKIISSNLDNPLNELESIFETEIKKWIGDGEQTDDMLLVGIKL